jgi:hypothetical protein
MGASAKVNTLSENDFQGSFEVQRGEATTKHNKR